jgi:hypothetical protein
MTILLLSITHFRLTDFIYHYSFSFFITFSVMYNFSFFCLFVFNFTYISQSFKIGRLWFEISPWLKYKHVRTHNFHVRKNWEGWCQSDLEQKSHWDPVSKSGSS